ncbi:LOW QUALITY PROTEIN: reverse transcriptase [Phytophthora megakarya]|uniref:Reverse transcriptase n=1 Tax=Phytophthora megakarya TaxID=4795 RepID=A0A225VQS0_9STRA|nr:LOW QUALITY PROTEIN: reverse transcriptase [Phytophthora megakarya]
MDFMVPTGIRLDLPHISIILPDEDRIQLSGRRQLYSDKAKIVNVGQYHRIQAGESVELALRLRSSIHDKLSLGADNIRCDEIYLDRQHRRRDVDPTTRPTDRDLADQRPCATYTGFYFDRLSSLHGVAESSFGGTPDTRSEEMEVKIPLLPTVERPQYETPRAILQRPKTTLIQCRKVEASQDQGISDCLPSDESPSDKSPSENRPLDLASVACEESDLSSIADEDSISHAVTVKEALEDLDQMTSDVWATNLSLEETTDVVDMREEDDRDEIGVVSQDQLHSRGQDQGTSPSKCGGPDLPSMMSVQSGTGHVTGDPLNDKCAASMSQKRDMDPSPAVEDQPGTSDLDLTWDAGQDYDECAYYHEGNDLYAEDVDGQMAVLPEVPVTTEDVKIEDIQLCGSDNQTPEEIDRLRQRIWKLRHLLIGKGNALPPAARGVVWDIDVGGARPFALKCSKLRIQFREKLADLIKGLLSTKMINYSRSPWASPIVVIIKKNGVDIMLCINYRLFNSANGLPNALGQRPTRRSGVDTLVLFFGYGERILGGENDGSCSFDLGFQISTFITSFGLFEWNRMPLA